MNWKSVLAGVVYFVAFAVLMLHCKQKDFVHIFLFFTVCFSSYGYLLYTRKATSIKWLIGLAVGLRVLCVFVFPNLSDDIYRFFWDGSLWAQGTHPFDYTPSQLLETGVLDSRLKEVYPLLNSKDYYTIYPPLLQLIFFIAAWLGKTFGGTALVMKIIYLAFDVCVLLGLIKILDYFKRDRKLAFVYFLNPLIIMELVGNLHAEVLMVMGLVWMGYFLLRDQYWKAGVFYAIAILSKILPLLIGPLLLLYVIKKKSWLPFFVSSGIIVLASFTLMLYGSNVSNLLDSIDLYFRSFEFNASIYYVGRALGYLNKGYNTIGFVGPFLAVVSLSFILWQSYQIYKNPRSEKLFSLIPLLYLIYLVFSTTIHPWYLAVPIAFAVFTPRYWFTIILWSFLVMLSYSAYDTDPVHEHILLLVIEYGLLIGALIYVSVNGPLKLHTN